MVLTSPKEEEFEPQEMTIQIGHAEAIADPLGSSPLPVGLPKGPCYIATLTLPAGAFKHTNLKASGKEYACRECHKTSSTQDPMMSHYLQDHPGGYLICAKYGMNYLDPPHVWHPW